MVSVGLRSPPEPPWTPCADPTPGVPGRKEPPLPDFLVTVDSTRLSALAPEERDDVLRHEREVDRQLIGAGTLRDIWRVPGKSRDAGSWSAADELPPSWRRCRSSGTPTSTSSPWRRIGIISGDYSDIGRP